MVDWAHFGLEMSVAASEQGALKGRAAAWWIVGNGGDRSGFDSWLDEIEMNSGIVGKSNSLTQQSATQSGFVIFPLLISLLMFLTDPMGHTITHTSTNKCVKQTDSKARPKIWCF